MGILHQMGITKLKWMFGLEENVPRKTIFPFFIIGFTMENYG